MSESEATTPAYYAFSDFSVTLVTRSEKCHDLMRRLTHFRQTDGPSEKNVTMDFTENADPDAFFAPIPPAATLQYEIKPAREGERGVQVFQQGPNVRWTRFPGFGSIFSDFEAGKISSRYAFAMPPNDLLPFIFFVIQPLTRMLSRFDYYFMHAAAVTLGGQGILVCGLSGRGKSTATMALIDGGHAALTDEYSFIKKEKDGFLVYSMMDWMKLSPAAHDRFFPHRKPGKWLCEEDCVYQISHINVYQPKQPFTIDGLFILSQSGQRETSIQPVGKLEVIPELLPISSSLYHPTLQRRQFEFFTDFLNTADCFRVSFGTEMGGFVSAVEQAVEKTKGMNN